MIWSDLCFSGVIVFLSMIGAIIYLRMLYKSRR